MKALDAKETEATPVAPSTGPVIRVEELHKYYELGETRVHALRGITLSVERGDFVAIMGTSGSGRALVNGPSILRADKPRGNLDSRTSVEIMEILQGLNEKGLTIFLVTHEHDIGQFAKRVLVFRDGKVRKADLVGNRPRAADV